MKLKVLGTCLLAVLAQTSMAIATDIPSDKHRNVANANGVIFVATTTTTPAATETGARKVLASFKELDSPQAWATMNDGVMGGISEGNFRRTEAGTLLFTGNLSLENNGGFTSIRSKPRPLDLSGMSAIVVKAKGDGRSYWVDIRVSQQIRASTYRAYLPTTAGEWTETLIPIKDFKLQAFFRELPSPPIKLAEVESIGLSLSDKKAGPFKLELESITAVAAGNSPGKTAAGKF